MKKLLIILMFATIFTSASCKNKLPTTKITIERADKTTIDVIAEIAKTPEAQRRNPSTHSRLCGKVEEES